MDHPSNPLNKIDLSRAIFRFGDIYTGKGHNWGGESSVKLLVQHRLADTSGAWGDYLRLSNISFLQLREEAYAQTLTAQAEYRLLYIREGSLYLVRNRVEAMYVGESLLLLPPEEEYHLHFVQGGQSTAYWISFGGYGCDRLLENMGLSGQLCLQIREGADLLHLFDGILRQSLPSQLDAMHRSLNSLGLFMQLLAASVPRLAPAAWREIRPASTEPDEAASDRPERGAAALAYAVHAIQSDLTTSLDVEAMARSLQMSASHFIRTFKAQVGYSPLAYQTKLRIERAKDLLRNTTLRVSEIALKVGYQNPMYFSSTFKKHTGMTPLEYRDKVLAS